MKMQVQKWGNSLAIRIPKPFAEALGLKANGSVEISLKDGQIVVAPAPAIYTLEELLAQITEDNKHGETDFGDPVGNEIW